MDEIEILEKKARLEAIEQLRQESGYYLYSPSKRNQPERSKREDFSYTVITNEDIEIEMKKMPKFKTYSELERCGALNSMET